MMNNQELKDYLIKNYRYLTNPEIEEETGCSGRKIRDFASRLGLEKPQNLKVRRRYTEEEKEMIASEYKTTPPKVLAEKLGIKVESLMRWASVHGLKRERDYNAAGENISEACKARGLGVSKENEDKIVSLYPDATDNEKLAEDVGVTYNQMRGVVKKHHLHKSAECLERIRLARSQKAAMTKLSRVTPEMRAERERKKREKEKEKESRRLERERKKEARKYAEPRSSKPKIKKLVSDPHVISSCMVNIEKPTSHEPCIGKKCRCYRFCFRSTTKERKYCDAYMYLEFTSELQKEAVISGMLCI